MVNGLYKYTRVKFIILADPLLMGLKRVNTTVTTQIFTPFDNQSTNAAKPVQ